MNSSLLQGYVKIFLALVFWASLYHMAPLPLEYVDIYLVGLIRYAMASLIFLLFIIFLPERYFHT